MVHKITKGNLKRFFKFQSYNDNYDINDADFVLVMMMMTFLSQVVLHGNVGEYSALVGSDNYYLEYEVMVEAFNDEGDGPNSTAVIVFSAMGSKCRKPSPFFIMSLSSLIITDDYLVT